MRHELGDPGGGNGDCKQAGYADEEERESMPGIHIGVGNRSHERMWRRVGKGPISYSSSCWIRDFRGRRDRG